MAASVAVQDLPGRDRRGRRHRRRRHVARRHPAGRGRGLQLDHRPHHGGDRAARGGHLGRRDHRVRATQRAPTRRLQPASGGQEARRRACGWRRSARLAGPCPGHAGCGSPAWPRKQDLAPPAASSAARSGARAAGASASGRWSKRRRRQNRRRCHDRASDRVRAAHRDSLARPRRVQSRQQRGLPHVPRRGARRLAGDDGAGGRIDVGLRAGARRHRFSARVAPGGRATLSRHAGCSSSGVPASRRTRRCARSTASCRPRQNR